MTVAVEYLSYDDIRTEANRFLSEYHSSNSIPVPIEDIVDIDLGIHIVPRLGLRGEIGQDGFFSSDLSTIIVDEYVYDYVDVRYRFTLAHEIGHAILHKSIYSSSFRTIEEWNKFQLEMPDKERAWLEWQADCFAGLVLVPLDKLEESLSNCITLIDREGISLKDNWDFAWNYIDKNIAKTFNVSSTTIQARIHYDKLKDRFR